MRNVYGMWPIINISQTALTFAVKIIVENIEATVAQSQYMLIWMKCKERLALRRATLLFESELSSNVL